jgi:hypothetical protein
VVTLKQLLTHLLVKGPALTRAFGSTMVSRTVVYLFKATAASYHDARRLKLGSVGGWYCPCLHYVRRCGTSHVHRAPSKARPTTKSPDARPAPRPERLYRHTLLCGPASCGRCSFLSILVGPGACERTPVAWTKSAYVSPLGRRQALMNTTERAPRIGLLVWVSSAPRAQITETAHEVNDDYGHRQVGMHGHHVVHEWGTLQRGYGMQTAWCIYTIIPSVAQSCGRIV